MAGAPSSAGGTGSVLHMAERRKLGSAGILNSRMREAEREK